MGAGAGYILELIDVTKRFGALTVLKDVSISLEPGTITALIGPNGAGKSTLFNVICGVYRPDGGRIYLEGRDITGLPPHEVCRMGISRTHQVPRPFSNMTVMENAMVPALYSGGPGPASDRALESLRLVGLEKKAELQASSLNMFERRMLEVARALAARPKLLLLDEPFAGLSPEEVELAKDTVKGLRDREGLTIFWVEHVMGVLRKVVDRVVVLNQGEKIADGPFRDVVHSANVIAAYLGEKIADEVG